ncbi:hypothetical protein [Tahibacter soli]|uniref:Uncharacterized protein n=1 Tax=Tahibacter soli TaxID=2983605 RepID=A0A9X3YPY1_9GAMM|nr:hypothetical protein [Tahibacter soli]MDC8015310.1 hypothetical protein [Tahibacter soli]
MQRLDLRRAARAIAFAVFAAVVVAACGGRARPDTVAAPDVPAAYDMTVIADKDGQFEVQGATLSEEDFKGALRYRRDRNDPVKTILLKRGEKQKVTDAHIAGLARIGLELRVRTFLQEKEGKEIQEIRTTAVQ